MNTTTLSRTYPRSLWSSNNITDHSEPSGTICPICKTHLSWAEYFSIAENFPKGIFTYHSCGKLLNYGNIQPELNEEKIRKAEDTHTYTQTWYHATIKQNWYKQVQNKDLLIHIGDLNTALARADLLHSDYRRPTYLYSFTINPENICTTILKDEDHWEQRFTPNVELMTATGKIINHQSETTGYPYHNLFENPGSLSLLTIPQIINQESISVQKLSRRTKLETGLAK